MNLDGRHEKLDERSSYVDEWLAESGKIPRLAFTPGIKHHKLTSPGLLKLGTKDCIVKKPLKQYSTHIKIGVMVLGFSQFIGWFLNLIIGLSYKGVFLVRSDFVIIDSVALGFSVWLSLYFARYLVEKSVKASLILLLSFGIMFGTGILSRVAFFLSNPASFLYADNRMVNYLLINLLFFCALNLIANGFVIFQHRMLERETALIAEKSLKTQMELSLLASKINPHFLFNSLNMMVSLLKNPEEAETALINLSEILRYQLDFSD